MTESKPNILWDIKTLMCNYPKLFPSYKAVRHRRANGNLPYIQFVKNGKIYFNPIEIEDWIKKHQIKEGEDV